MDEKRVKILVDHWIKMAKHDEEVVDILFDNKRYVEALFWQHLIVEKILKAHVVLVTREEAPKIHNLSRLAKLAELELSEAEWEFLDRVSRFDLRTRYADEQLEFYKIANKEYASSHLSRMKEMYQKLCQQLKQKK